MIWISCDDGMIFYLDQYMPKYLIYNSPFTIYAYAASIWKKMYHKKPCPLRKHPSLFTMPINQCGTIAHFPWCILAHRKMSLQRKGQLVVFAPKAGSPLSFLVQGITAFFIVTNLHCCDKTKGFLKVVEVLWCTTAMFA